MFQLVSGTKPSKKTWSQHHYIYIYLYIYIYNMCMYISISIYIYVCVCVTIQNKLVVWAATPCEAG